MAGKGLKMSDDLTRSNNSARVAPAWRVVGFWALKVLLALLFLAVASFKFSGAPAAVAEFQKIGFGQWFRYFTGGCELLGAVLLLIPRTTVYGAILLTCVSVGAFLAQLLVLHQDVVHTIVLIVAAGAIAWSQRRRVFGAA